MGPGIAVLDAVTTVWQVSNLSLFARNAKPVVGMEVVAFLGSDWSLVLELGQTTTAMSAVLTTSSRNEVGRLRG